jgi:hypothetical protein
MDEVKIYTVISRDAPVEEQITWFMENWGLTEIEAVREVGTRTGAIRPLPQGREGRHHLASRGKIGKRVR